DQLESAATRAGTAERQLAAVQREDQLVLEQRLRLGQLEGRWLLARWAILGLAVSLSITGAVAAIARRRERGATRFARSMAHELEEKGGGTPPARRRGRGPPARARARGRGVGGQ